MIKTLKYLFVLEVFLSGCGSDYEIKNKKVYYVGSNEGVGNYEILVKKADASTFRKIPNDESLLLGKDKNYIFFEDSIIGTNPKTFNRIGNYYFKDKLSVYFFGFVSGGRFKWTLDNVDVNTFKTFEIYPWARDKNHLIYGDINLKVKNLNRFKPIDEYWGKTDTEVINKYTVFENVDMKTFEIIDNYRAKDSKYKYDNGKKIK